MDEAKEVVTEDSWSFLGKSLFNTPHHPPPRPRPLPSRRKKIRGECFQENMRDDTGIIIRLIFKTNMSGIIYPNKCDPLLSSRYRGLWPYSNDTALASQSLGLFLLPCHLGPGFETYTEDSYYFIAPLWFRSASVCCSHLWPISYLSDSAWCDFRPP